MVTAKGTTRAANVLVELRRLAQANIARLSERVFPMVSYQADPVAFVREQLGEEPLPHQEKIMMAVARDPTAKVSVRSGQKQGKTKLVIWLALWFWASFPGARVFLTASTAPQVQRVLWSELKNTARIALQNKGTDFGEIPLNPERGLESSDGRSIQGFTTRSIEAMAGLSGANMLFIGDEASSFETAMAEAIEGNTAGAARIIWISNPTRAEGPFFESFHSKKQYWKNFHLNSEDLAAAVATGKVKRVPGIATPEVIARWRDEYGADSPFYLVRVRGEFLLNEATKIIPLHAIFAAQARHKDGSEEGGLLSIGIDPAGDSGEGDEWAFSSVRGPRQVGLLTKRGLSEDAAVGQTLALIRDTRKDGETPRLTIDAEGPIGSAFYGRMRALARHLEIHDPPNAFEVVGIKGSQPARREPALYERIRDELWASVAVWLKAGAIAVDIKQEQELYAPSWLVTVTGKRKASSKDELRERLGRSPDRGDALCLAVWAPTRWIPEEDGRLPSEERNADPTESIYDPTPQRRGHDPYASPWGRRGR